MDSTIIFMPRKIRDPVRLCYLGEWWSFVVGVGNDEKEGNEVQTSGEEMFGSLKNKTIRSFVSVLNACSLLTYIKWQTVVWRSTVILDLGDGKTNIKKNKEEKECQRTKELLQNSAILVIGPEYIEFKWTGRVITYRYRCAINLLR